MFIGLRILKDSKNTRRISLILFQNLFHLNEYDSLINYLEPILDSTKCNYYSSLVLLQAQAFYQTDAYDPAVVYFEEKKLSGYIDNKSDLSNRIFLL